jgi:hypothetical protein
VKHGTLTLANNLDNVRAWGLEAMGETTGALHPGVTFVSNNTDPFKDRNNSTWINGSVLEAGETSEQKAKQCNT